MMGCAISLAFPLRPPYQLWLRYKLFHRSTLSQDEFEASQRNLAVVLTHLADRAAETY